eukprot:202768-Rhodomonas_salina.1
MAARRGGARRGEGEREAEEAEEGELIGAGEAKRRRWSTSAPEATCSCSDAHVSVLFDVQHDTPTWLYW